MLENIPPWDQLPYYDVPTETVVTVGNTATQIVGANAQRVILVMGFQAPPTSYVAQQVPTYLAAGPIAVPLLSGGVTVSIRSTMTANDGYPLSGQGTPLVLPFDWYGPLVQQAWFAAASSLIVGPVNVTVSSITMRNWPGRGPKSLIEMADEGLFRGAAGRRANGIGRAKLYTDRWSQRQAISDKDFALLIQSCLRNDERPGGG